MIGYRIAQLFAALQVASYADTVRNIALGSFDKIGLAAPMIRMEAVANGLSAAGWATVLTLSLLGNGVAAGRIAYGLAGMMWFDVLTTWRLDIPRNPSVEAMTTSEARGTPAMPLLVTISNSRAVICSSTDNSMP